ncbi:trypsin-like serine protease [Duganella sp. CY15W]|uniref:S1 family peptidase n=1 Tax=Duganella sp. CY15W TaxID=2692172 RepID=UPI00136F3941|nr:S1 family peptidase [Duganella sp. CY15W]MYM29947.1 trypsin-like serine protease [Duganella sp. CY15W]
MIQSKALKLIAVVTALLGASAAQANNSDLLTPLTGNTTAPSNWRFTPGQSFNGVAGALDGVARLSFSNSGGNWACSGSLLAGGQYVLTAAHCADDFTKMKVDFGWANGTATVTRTVAVTNAYVNPKWNGTLDTGADIAILKLDQAVTTIKGYNLSTTNDVGKDYLMAGYGTTSRGGSNVDPNWNDSAWGHYGYNTFDIDSKTFNKVGDQATGWGYDPAFYAPGTTYMSDYDDGTAAHNTLGRIAGASGNAWTSGTGLGNSEALIAGGDSGGGDFVWNGKEWLLSAVHSWGWQGSDACSYFSLNGCDSSTKNSSSFGDLSGSTATFSHIGWINSVTAVPEPETYAMMVSGLALVGLASRRRRAKTAA